MPINMVKTGTTVNLTKGEQVVMSKPSSGSVTASAIWSAEKDYDVLGLVVMKDGSVHWAAQFGTTQTPRYTPEVHDSKGNIIVTHMGDVEGQSGGLKGRLFGKKDKGLAKEDLRIISASTEVDRVYVVVYSARKNGPGSFHSYGVSMVISDGNGTEVRFDASSANNDSGVYTCVPGVVHFRPEGLVVEALGIYSKGGENRPAIINGKLVMDRGEENVYK